MGLRLDRLLLALYMARHFPVQRLEQRFKSIRSALVSPDIWNWIAMRQRYVKQMRERASDVRTQARNLKEAGGELAKLLASVPVPVSTFVNEVHIDALENVEFAGQRFRLPPALRGFYFPALVPFRDERDRRPAWEQGLGPFLTFLRHFDNEFVTDHLTAGIHDIAVHVFEGYADHADSMATILERFGRDSA